MEIITPPLLATDGLEAAVAGLNTLHTCPPHSSPRCSPVHVHGSSGLPSQFSYSCYNITTTLPTNIKPLTSLYYCTQASLHLCRRWCALEVKFARVIERKTRYSNASSCRHIASSSCSLHGLGCKLALSAFLPSYKSCSSAEHRTSNTNTCDNL